MFVNNINLDFLKDNKLNLLSVLSQIKIKEIHKLSSNKFYFQIKKFI
jgi:hypothetical protein